MTKTIATAYFAAEEKSVCERKKLESVNSTCHDLDASFLKHSQWFSYGKEWHSTSIESIV